MSEVNQDVPPQNGAVSTVSDDRSVAGPVLAAHVRTEFSDKVPKNAEMYSRMVDTVTFEEWMEHSNLWIVHLRFPNEHRLSAALMLLRAPVLSFWKSLL